MLDSMFNLARPTSRVCDIADRKYVFKSLSLLKNLSTDATVAGIVKNILKLIQTFGNNSHKSHGPHGGDNCFKPLSKYCKWLVSPGWNPFLLATALTNEISSFLYINQFGSISTSFWWYPLKSVRRKALGWISCFTPSSKNYIKLKNTCKKYAPKQVGPIHHHRQSRMFCLKLLFGQSLQTKEITVV